MSAWLKLLFLSASMARRSRLVIVINWLAKQQSSFLKVRNYLYPVSKKACQLVDLVNNVSSSSWTVRGRWNDTCHTRKRICHRGLCHKRQLSEAVSWLTPHLAVRRKSACRYIVRLSRYNHSSIIIVGTDGADAQSAISIGRHEPRPAGVVEAQGSQVAGACENGAPVLGRACLFCRC